MNDIEIITTSDGSHSLLNTALNETYHSVHGAVQESRHVFIRHGLEFFLARTPGNPVRIFEVGFGTGLNALLTAQAAKNSHRKIQYTSIEAFPLSENIWGLLNYTDSGEAEKLFRLLHESEWLVEKSITENFSVQKLHTTLQQLTLEPSRYDVVYYDAFAPSKQPELWELPLLEKVIRSMKPDSVFVTYCAKGQLKRDLRALGCFVETLPGPPGKKEMVRALKN